MNNIDKIREFIACPQFGDDHYGKWGALRYDQKCYIKYLYDYAKRLEAIVEKQNGYVTLEVPSKLVDFPFCAEIDSNNEYYIKGGNDND